ncbi:hypothetical protein AALH12_07185 [Streptococcus ferus]|uniref:hypothetical protein n=1 Tax=Streptococcus ferus TaxID=1345 RepID=UPI00351422A9
MLGDYSIMDLVTVTGVLAAVASTISALGYLVKVWRDNKAISERLDNLSNHISNGGNALSKEHNVLTDKVISERKIISKENEAIKHDTEYVYNEILAEKMARESLYKNSARAKEILDQLDIMREVVFQNAKLNAEKAELTVKVSQLETQNKELSNLDKDSQAVKQLSRTIKAFDNKLSNFEGYGETEEIQYVLRQILNDLSESV